MIFSGIDTFSLLDYDGYISIVLFSPGCNFKCPFCHNYKNVVLSNDQLSHKKIYEYLKSRVGLVDAVTFSGGEPTLQKDLIDTIKEVKKLGYKIKLDTNGSNPKVLKELLDENLLDYVAMDIKASPNKYDLVSGINVNLENINQSIELIKKYAPDYEFRTTLVDEYFTPEDIKEIGKLLQGTNKLFLQKYVYRDGVLNPSLHEVKEEKAKEYQKILKDYIKNVELRGY